MPSLFRSQSLPKTLYLDNFPIHSNDVQLLDKRRTVYRFTIDPGSYRHNLPQTITTVIVKQQKEGWEEEFNNEKAAYDRLKELQGNLIPFFFGQGYYDGLPALVLSEVRGITLYELARSKNDFPRAALETSLEDAFRQFSEYGALYRDQRLDNFVLCDHDCQKCKVMVLDLEQVDFPDHLRPWEKLINSDGTMSLMRDFEDLRYPDRWISDVLGDWLNLSEEFGMQYLVAQAEKVRGTHVLPVSLSFDGICPKVHGTGVFNPKLKIFAY